ncbi:SMP-30/gluconolactonase/LRE family protein [Paludisphaera sp.]|uniref:SMP-30/gluconolactonase/LRE family protein n=1 Tax=Paludisphaera sp. TaxID=2017432 RepID=UPI00301CBF63
MEILRDAGLSGLVEGDRVETLATGFEFTEGPLWLPNGSILFQDIKAEKTYLLPPGGRAEVFRDRNGAANGQTFLPDGDIVFCEQTGRKVSRLALATKEPVDVAVEWGGKRLNSPNDVVARSDGSIYFTDPPYGVKPEDREIDFLGVYRWTATDGPMPLARDFEKPNGLAFSPDEKTLYVADTARYHTRAFPVRPDGTLDVDAGRVFAEHDPGVAGGPDGVKVDRAGRVYVAVALGIWVYEPDGRLLGILPTPQRPSNLNWGDADARALIITAVDAVHSIRFKDPGIAPIFQPAS